MTRGCNRWIYPNWQDEMKAKLRSQGDASSAWVSIERAAWGGCVVRKPSTLHPLKMSQIWWLSFLRHLAAESSIRRGYNLFGGFVRAQVRCTSSFYRCSFFISGWSLKKTVESNCIVSVYLCESWICLGFVWEIWEFSCFTKFLQSGKHTCLRPIWFRNLWQLGFFMARKTL